jgi:hypothetical protein
VFLGQWAEVLRLDGGNQAGVGEGRVAPGQAHAVDDHFVILGGCRDDPAAGAHAERMHAAVADLGGEAVACGRQQARPFLPGIEVILVAVDERLRVLDAETDGEGLGFQQDLP